MFKLGQQMTLTACAFLLVLGSDTVMIPLFCYILFTVTAKKRKSNPSPEGKSMFDNAPSLWIIYGDLELY